MDSVLLAILILLAVAVGLVAVALLRLRAGDSSAALDDLLKERFLAFQTDIRRELSETRVEVTRSKDLISDHAVKTIKTINDMGATLHKITQQQDQAQKLGQSLKDVLQAPKLRGNYGETVLEELLERVLPRGIWERQYCVDGREQVDAVVKLKDVVFPIDAKFPGQNYRRYLDAPSPEQKARFWKEYEGALKAQIRSIRTKYVKPEKGTSEFALMFIPSEAVYYETIAETNYLGEPSGLFEFAQENKVIPVSPNTLYAFLQVVILGVRNLEIIDGARKLQDGLASLERSFGFFYKKYEEIGKSLQKATDSHRTGDAHIERYKRQLDATLCLEGFQSTGKPTEAMSRVASEVEQESRESADSPGVFQKE